jgi:hypothetical protein
MTLILSRCGTEASGVMTCGPSTATPLSCLDGSVTVPCMPSFAPIPLTVGSEVHPFAAAPGSRSDSTTTQVAATHAEHRDPAASEPCAPSPPRARRRARPGPPVSMDTAGASRLGGSTRQGGRLNARLSSGLLKRAGWDVAAASLPCEKMLPCKESSPHCLRSSTPLHLIFPTPLFLLRVLAHY